MFTIQQTQFLQRLVSQRPPQKRAGGAATHFCQNFSLGTTVGQVVIYNEAHFRMAESILRAHDLPVVAPDSDASRADMAAFGGMSEKELSSKPHADSVAVRFIGDCRLDGSIVSSPPGAYLVVNAVTAQRVQCDRLMVVENLETFRQLERYQWIDYEALSVMAVFRGDPRLSIGDALTAIRGSTALLWAFVDFDPAGMLVANGLPESRLEKLVLPSREWLRQAADTPRGRQLFADQVAGCENVLDRTEDEAIRSAWALMRELRCGVTQERMLAASPAISNY